MNLKLLKINSLQLSYRYRRTGLGVGQGVVAVNRINQPDIPFEIVLCHNMWYCAYKDNE